MQALAATTSLPTQSAFCQATEAALVCGTPSTEAIDGCSRVLLAIAPLCGPLEPAMQRIAIGAETAARGPLVDSPISEARSRRAFFEVVARQEEEVSALTAERDAALAQLDANQRQVATREATLSATRADLVQQTCRIDEIMRDQAAKQKEMAAALAEGQRAMRRYEEGRARGARAVREQHEEETRLESQIALLRQEYVERQRAELSFLPDEDGGTSIRHGHGDADGGSADPPPARTPVT